MLRPGTIRKLAVYSASLVAAPGVANATIYIPSHLVARTLGNCQPDAAPATDAPNEHPEPSTSHAA